MKTDNKHIIIIGSGMAGYTLLREIRKIDKQIKITLICADSGDFYSKPMLSNALDKQKTPDSLVMQSADKMLETQNFELIKHTSVTSIDTENQQVFSQNNCWQYSRLILATGAKPVVLPLKGSGAEDILSVNNLDDYRQFRHKLEQANSIAIIGPGLIGCEFANDLLCANKQVSIIGPDPWPISNLLPQSVGEYLQQKLQQPGITLHLQKTVESVNKNELGYQLKLSDGHEIESDLILSAVGLRANLDLAKDTGIKTARAFTVDKHLQTNMNNVYALGDCAEVEGLFLPYIMPIMQSARALAQTMTGTPTAVTYPAMPVAIKTPACPLVVSPPATQQDNWQIIQTEGGIKALCYQNDELIGFALAGDAVSEKQSLTKLLPAIL